MRGEELGTYVAPHESKLSARKLWIAFGQRAEGTVTVDDGAVRAMQQRGSSLLPVGVVAVDGEFGAGAAVEVNGPDGEMVAKGVSSLSAGRLREAMGRRSDELGVKGEAIHRDQLVVLTNGG